MLGKRRASGPAGPRRTSFKRKYTPGPRSSVGVVGAGLGSVRYAGRDWYGTIDSPTADAVGSLGTYAGLNPLRNLAMFERLSPVVKGFAQYRFRKLNIIIKGQGGTAKGQLVMCYFHNDGKGGGPSITAEATVKSTGYPCAVKGDGYGVLRCKQDSEWLATDTNIGTSTIVNSPGTVYYFNNATPGLADCTWDVWIDYVIEMKDPVRPTAID